MNTDELASMITRVDRKARDVLSQSRYEHSVRVGAMARDLCERFGLNPDVGYLAGIAHDLCKSAAENVLISLASRDGFPITEIETRKPSLLHGRAAAVLLRTEFGLADSGVLEAVRNHTFGAQGLGDLGKIIFVADKIEPGRLGIDPAFREGILRANLVVMTRMVLEDNIRYLNARGKTVSPESQKMLDELKNQG
jgi:nicotinate-nucleotide adenylyltransferase